MKIKRNFIEATLTDGTKVGFRTGPLAISAACSKAGCGTTEQLFVKLSTIDLVATLALFYGAAYEYAESRGLPTTFSMADVADWLEDLGNEKTKEISEKIQESYVPKNLNPPVDLGESTEQPSMIGSILPVSNLV